MGNPKHPLSDDLYHACRRTHDFCYYLNSGHAGLKGQHEKLLRQLDDTEAVFARVREAVLEAREQQAEE